MDGLYELVTEHDPALRLTGREKFRSLGAISFCFLVGAVVGAWAAPRLGNEALLLTEPPLLIVLLLVWLRHRD